MASTYFDGVGTLRQLLMWTTATRRQLDRWEPLVARHIAALPGFQPRREPLTDAEVWQAAAEHHFALTAARNLIRAIELLPAGTIAIDPDLRADR